MSAPRRATSGRPSRVLDVLCMAGEGGAIGIPAAHVELVREDEDQGDGARETPDAGAGRVPSIDLRPLLGARRGAAARRLRVTASAGAFDVVTDAVLSVRTIDRAALRPVPIWIAPFVAAFGAGELLLDEDAAVLLADPEKLAEGALHGRE